MAEADATIEKPTSLQDISNANGLSGLQQTPSSDLESNGAHLAINGVESDLGNENMGTLCKVKTLYEGQPKCTCCINWVEIEPTDLRENIEEQRESKNHALLIRMRKNHDGGKPLALHSIVVQSARLKVFLGEVFKDYEGITTTLQKLVFQPPFHPFFYEWKRMNELIAAQDTEGEAYARLLQDILNAELSEALSISEDLTRNNVVTFDYLWTVFKVGMECHTVEGGRNRMFKLTEARYVEGLGEPFYQLRGHFIDFDGHDFGWATLTITIEKFAGTKPLSDLEAIPTSLHPHSKELQEELRIRGEKFRSLQQVPYHHGEYHGLGKMADGKKFKVNGRILLDDASYRRFNFVGLALKPLNDASTATQLDVTDSSQNHDRRGHRHAYIGGPPPFDSEHEFPPEHPPPFFPPGPMPHSRRHGSQNRIEMKTDKQPQVEDSMLHLCSPEVRGYCLKTKKWASFYVDLVTDIRWNKEAFGSLVLAENVKKMILAFVQSQAANKDTFDDVIEGKGRGIIMLLEGSPGVGKTLTAEAVADKLHRPLYSVSGGQLGESAEEVEGALSMILELAAKWDAVLLLDECDVFLEKRGVNNLRRNGTVSVFLRLLEYYTGVLFMTTNRVDTIDPAFQSRIHLTIEYPKLSEVARCQIWKQFLAINCPDTKIGEQEIQVLAKVDLNGREIKNLIKTAQLLARHENVTLDIEHCQTVLQVTKWHQKDGAQGVDLPSEEST